MCNVFCEQGQWVRDTDGVLCYLPIVKRINCLFGHYVVHWKGEDRPMGLFESFWWVFNLFTCLPFIWGCRSLMVLMALGKHFTKPTLKVLLLVGMIKLKDEIPVSLGDSFLDLYIICQLGLIWDFKNWFTWETWGLVAPSYWVELVFGQFKICFITHWQKLPSIMWP